MGAQGQSAGFEGERFFEIAILKGVGLEEDRYTGFITRRAEGTIGTPCREICSSRRTATKSHLTEAGSVHGARAHNLKLQLELGGGRGD